ncbi:hypothetical protein CSUI_009088 [Cystoisospora suis]|uniref:Uncharacterized protein n=1 Tax=Cystoisospora suis TaxID=483139 RepID=A0A2C6KL26_9APIC|nr:hypothetical protein CSUI_009088 [Cystoisospora suis]
MAKLFAEEGVQDIMQGVDSPAGTAFSTLRPSFKWKKNPTSVKMQRKEEEVSRGKFPSCPHAKRNHTQEAKAEYEKIMDPQNQADLQKALPPQERMRYDQQRIAQIKNQISVYKQNVERAKKAIR